MVEQMKDIVLDEARVAMSPDEMRLQTGAGRKEATDEQKLRRAAAKNAPQHADDEDDMFMTADMVGDVEEGFIDMGSAPADLEAPEEAMVNDLFARRKDAPAIGAQDNTMADDLFTRKRGAPPRTSEDSGEKSDEDLEAGDDEASDEGRRCRLCRSCFSCDLPDKLTVAKYGACASLFIGVFATVTFFLAAACKDQALLKQVCVSEGAVQWIIAFAPLALFLFCIFCLVRNRYSHKVEAKASAWQHDAEAQKNAAELLDQLAIAPAAERHKYASQAVQILSDFPAKALIQAKGLSALEAICRAQRGNVQHVHAAGAVPVILKALDAHLRVRKVQTSGLAALACLAKIGKKQVFDLGGIETVCRSMAKFKRDPAVQVSGAMALGALCLSSVQNRHSVAKFGGAQILLQALERHVERADVQIAASETLALIAQDTTSLQRQLLAALPVVQGIAARYEGARAANGSKKAKDIEIVLRSLRKLEGKLAELAEIDEEDAASDVATPRLEGQEGSHTVQTNTHQAGELHSRLNQWTTKASNNPKR
jgi:hypothetical protein